MARDGATPTIFGPSPLNRAREPSVLTIYLKCEAMLKLFFKKSNKLNDFFFEFNYEHSTYFKHCQILMDCELEDIPQWDMVRICEYRMDKYQISQVNHTKIWTDL